MPTDPSSVRPPGLASPRPAPVIMMQSGQTFNPYSHPNPNQSSMSTIGEELRASPEPVEKPVTFASRPHLAPSPKPSKEGPQGPKPFTGKFFDKDPESAKHRKMYLRIVGSGTLLIVVTVLSVLSIYWGSTWKGNTALHNLHGWIVDFDGSDIGQAVTQAFMHQTGSKDNITWLVRPTSDFPNGEADLVRDLKDDKAWTAVLISANATDRLNAAIASADRTYDGSTAVTAFGIEARNENVYGQFIVAALSAGIESALASFGAQNAAKIATSGATTAGNLLAQAPQTIVAPFGFTINNLIPFDIPVAEAVDFVGLIYLLILSFISTLMNFNARVVTQVDRRLSLRSLILLRFGAPAIAYFFISLAFTVLSRAFQVTFDRKFGDAGFVIYWMLAWCSMMALGFAVESMLTLLTPRFIPFFLVIWIIVNVSVVIFPPSILPTIFRYGYAMPFYNTSQATRTILFGTRNQVGLNFGVLFAWIAVSMVSLPLLQLWRRRQMLALAKTQNRESIKQEVVQDRRRFSGYAMEQYHVEDEWDDADSTWSVPA